MHDLAIAFRRLRAQPVYTSIAAVTLALGIGATTAIFSVISAVLLTPLAYPDQHELVSVGHSLEDSVGIREVFLSSGSYLVYRDENRTLTDLAMYSPTGMNLSGVEPPMHVDAAAVSANFFTTLGVSPLLGRGLALSSVTESDATPPAVISYGLWQRLFGGDPGTVGTTVRLDERALEVVGVMPAGFSFPSDRTDVWYRVQLTTEQARNVNFAFRGIGRLSASSTIDQAQADLDSLFERPFELFRNEGISAAALRERGFRVDVRALADTVVGDVGEVLWVLMGAVGLILLVACSNVANLSMVQAETRERDLAVQSALGAGRGRLFRQSLLESLVLGGLGGVLGASFAWAGTRLLVALEPEQLPRLGEIGVDTRVLAFAAAVSALAALLSGALPALRFRTGQIAATLKASGGSSGGTGWQRHSRNALVAGQLSLALILLVAAGLMLRTFANLRSVDPGFEPASLLLFDLTPTSGQLSDSPEVLAFHQRVLDELARLPEVAGATAASRFFGLPIANPANPNPVWVRDQLPAQGALPPSQVLRIVMPEYFETLQIRPLAGRLIERRDVEEATGVAVVSQSFARDHWGEESPIGKIISPLPSAGWLTVVGVVDEVNQSTLYDPPAPTVYFAPLIPTDDRGATPYTAPRPMIYAVRAVGDPMSLIAQVRGIVRELDPALPLANVRTMQQEIARSMSRTSFTMTLLIIGAAIAVLLGVIGVYGVMAYVVNRRTAEIGVRMALGARRGTIQRLVVSQAASVVAVGVALGLGGALGMVGLLESFLFGVAPLDPATYVAVTLVLAAAAVVASYVPARRASRVDPVLALRGE